MVVDARPGAGATLAATQVARAAPDGYTLLGIPSGHAVSAAMYRKLGYRPVEDFTYISTVTEYPFVLVTHPEHPAKTLKDLVAIARSRKEPLLYGGPNGTLQHLSVELFARVADIRVQLVPYRGSPQAVADLLGKRLDFMLDPPTAHLEAIKGGQLRALATTGAARFFALPDVPTVAEQGIKDFVIGSWQGVIGPGRPAGRHRQAPEQGDRRGAGRAGGGGAAEDARQRSEGLDAGRIQEPRRVRHRQLDQGDRGREHRADLRRFSIRSSRARSSGGKPSGESEKKNFWIPACAGMSVGESELNGLRLGETLRVIG